MPAQNYAVKYQSTLDQAITQGTVTNGLVTPDVDWIGGKTFRIPSITTSGYRQHSRDGGFKSGTVNVDDKPYTVTQDRSVEFFVDAMDVDETNEALSVSNITKVFLNENANPEIDAYRLSTLAQNAGVKSTLDDASDSAVIYKALKADLRKVRKYGTSGTFCYVSTEVMSAIEDAREDKVTVVISNEGTTIETRVTVIDGVKVTEVFDRDRFWSEYNYEDGFVPTETAKKLNWVIVSKKAVISAVKHSAVYLFKPGTHTSGDGYLYQNRIYHDLFVKSRNKDGVIVSSGGAIPDPEPEDPEGDNFDL